ncbi:CDP-diacylglycerol--serine O-phosphatidyltransferase [Helicobacter trogontum]|uniref:CDP-diacylglycerol--serine O-phosphatidyltransferase n=1 Tax=Helicobacter trogontum TaxID=50960 RepID=A0A4U8SF71_9HELI|nr:CDP-diacylglycerol--serine O-phosphatidyltransferase [Helicobacter trogontum]TLD84859.1 CDP-diacylglycerol--serine O-phosphatidyltransferase [Helicobacter trogontum]
MKISPRYVLPNLFTAGSIFLGIMAIFMAHKGLVQADSKAFTTACWYILFSMVLDGLDGRVARLTNTASKFGVEFDSLADIVAFGVAPAVLLYFYVGYDYGRYGVAISGLFVVLGAIRLARFNITTNVETNSFIGLPIPSAAAILCLWIIVVEQHKVSFFGWIEFLRTHTYIFLVFAFFIAILMVSNIRYPSFKKVQWNLKYFVVLLIALAFVVAQPSLALCIFLSMYIFYGVLRWIFIVLFRIVMRKNDNEESTRRLGEDNAKHKE